MEPIPMLLHCPICRAKHVDDGEFTTKPHHTHACQVCGHVWRPAIVPTVGVQFLPGYKNEESNDTTEVTLENGKYTWIVNSTGEVSCRRFGEPWIETFPVGGKALISLIHFAAQKDKDASKALEIGADWAELAASATRAFAVGKFKREPTSAEVALIIRWLFPAENLGTTYGDDSPAAKTMRDKALEAWEFFRGFPAMPIMFGEEPR